MVESMNVQKMYKIARIITFVGIVISLLGVIVSFLSATALIRFPTLADWVTVSGLSGRLSTLNEVQGSALLFSVMIGSIVALVINFLLYRHTNRVIVDGTPFTRHSAEQMRMVGVISIGLAIIAMIVNGIIVSSAGMNIGGLEIGKIMLGIGLIMGSYLIAYGSQLEIRNAQIHPQMPEMPQ